MTFFQSWRMPAVVSDESDARSVDQERAFAWNFERGDVLSDGAGNVVVIEGEAAWRQWVVLALMTQRGAFAVFDRLYGADLDTVQLEGDARRKESIARRTLSAAAMQHPNTRSVEVVLQQLEDDVMHLEVRAVSVRGEQLVEEVIV